MNGADSDLGGARKTMDQNIARLQNATEFAILGNTEELKRMSSELQRNQATHTAMLQEQREIMGTIRDTTEGIRNDMAMLLKAFGDQNKGKDQKAKASAAEQNKPPSAKRIRNTLPDIEGDIHEYHILKETIVPDTGTWIFSEPAWDEWLKKEDGSRPVLAITGQPGTGKSHVAAIVHDKLLQQAQEDASKHTCIAHFYFREQSRSLSTLHSAIVTIINQVVEQSVQVCERINAEYSKDDVDINVWSWESLVRKLLAPAFTKRSKDRLFVVLDGLDELSSLNPLASFLNIVKELELRISVVVTSRPDRLQQTPGLETVAGIVITKKKQEQDLKSLVWNRINSLSALRMFSRYVQQRVADKTEEAAPSKKTLSFPKSGSRC